MTTTPRPHPIALRLPKQTSMQPDAGLQAQLEARGASLSAVIKESLARYFTLLDLHRNDIGFLPLAHAISLYMERAHWHADYRIAWLREELDVLSEPQAYALLDALERASLLVGRTGCTIDAALRDVGLIAE